MHCHIRMFIMIFHRSHRKIFPQKLFNLDCFKATISLENNIFEFWFSNFFWAYLSRSLIHFEKYFEYWRKHSFRLWDKIFVLIFVFLDKAVRKIETWYQHTLQFIYLFTWSANVNKNNLTVAIPTTWN